MSNSFFDESEFAEQSEEGDEETAADEALESLEQSPEAAEESEEAALADVDLRLEIADYYRAILKHPFFDTTASAAKHVDREIRTFIRERLEVLLGLRGPRQPNVAAQFDDGEVAVLKALAGFDENDVRALKVLAAKVLKKPALVTESPVVRRMPTPTVKKPVEVSRPKPTVNKIPAPAPAPSTKPQPKPAPKKVQAKPQPKPAEKPQAKPAPKKKPAKKDDGEVQTYIDHAGKKVTLVEGEVIEENGRRYLVARNDAGTLYRRDITGQVVAPGRIPPMSVQQMSIISQQQAEAQLAALDETTGIAIVASLTKQE